MAARITRGTRQLHVRIDAIWRWADAIAKRGTGHMLPVAGQVCADMPVQAELRGLT